MATTQLRSSFGHRLAYGVIATVTMAALALPSVVHAMRVSPMVVEMQTGGANAVARVQVQNINKGDLPFETRITRIDFDDSGNINETPADEDFLVFPPQGLLKAGQRQVIRLQWLGPVDLPASRGYYISINQLPVSLEPGNESAPGASVQIVYHMKALVTVAPPRATPRVSVVSVKPITMAIKPAEGATPLVATDAAAPPAEPAIGPGLEVVVRNTGTRYAMMAGAKWTITGKDQAGKPLTVVVGPDELNCTVGVGYLAPLNGTRTFKVPTASAFGAAPISIEFSN